MMEKRFWHNFLIGAAHILDFSSQPSQPLSAQEAAKADTEALAGDWQAVGEDLRLAMGLRPLASKEQRNDI